MVVLQWWYISYILILISVIVSLIAWQNTSLFRYGFNKTYYSEENYTEFMKQVGLFQFIHGDILHLVMNSYFLYVAGPILEQALWASNFLIFFLSTTLVSAFALYFFAPKSNTIGISGFCMALLSYLGIDLYTTWHPMASQILVMLVINIAIGLTGNISFVGHASGALFGVITWFFLRNKF